MTQSPDIAGAVDGSGELGAGDQGIVYGYACEETPELLPLPVVLAHRLTRLLTEARKRNTIPGIRPDGKAEVAIEYRNGRPKRVAAVVVSCQHEEEMELPELRRAVVRHVIQPAFRDFPLDDETKILINPSGRFVEGGFEADTGLTGRKLMVDTYGGLAPHGGGALSGKDGTKVDRSGAYMARYIAKNIVAAGAAKRCTVSLGVCHWQGPSRWRWMWIRMAPAIYRDEVLEEAVRVLFDLTPSGMIARTGAGPARSSASSAITGTLPVRKRPGSARTWRRRWTAPAGPRKPGCPSGEAYRVLFLWKGQSCHPLTGNGARGAAGRSGLL